MNAAARLGRVSPPTVPIAVAIAARRLIARLPLASPATRGLSSSSVSASSSPSRRSARHLLDHRLSRRRIARPSPFPPIVPIARASTDDDTARANSPRRVQHASSSTLFRVRANARTDDVTVVVIVRTTSNASSTDVARARGGLRVDLTIVRPSIVSSARIVSRMCKQCDASMYPPMLTDRDSCMYTSPSRRRVMTGSTRCHPSRESVGR